jgi:hypothetical protein
MVQDTPAPVYATPAILWDGIHQLSGSLEIWDTEIVFRFADFRNSHLNLSVPLVEIEAVEKYLVYDLAKNGLQILDKEGRIDLFVLEEVSEFKHTLLQTIAQLKK